MDLAIKLLCVSILLLALCLGFCLASSNDQSSKKGFKEPCTRAHEDYEVVDFSSAELNSYSKYAIAVDSTHCATVAKSIFERNGSAVDAAIAAGLCNSVMNIHSMGIGGGHFMNIYLRKEKKAIFINAREMAPSQAHRLMFADGIERAQIGGLATAIPGELKGYEEAHRRFGKLPWKDLFEPAIKLCENGFRISKTLSKAINVSEADLRKNPAITNMFSNPMTGLFYQSNDQIRLERLAQTLRLVSEKGADEFYNGSLTPIIVDEINRNGGNVTIKDFAEYQVKVEEIDHVIKLDEVHRVYASPPPTSSVLIAFVLQVMRSFVADLRKDSQDFERAELFHHRLVETFKHTYAQRSKLGDKDYMNIQDVLDNLKNETFIKSVVDKIDDKKTMPSEFYGDSSPLSHHGTAHISMIGPDGDAVSLTSTINAYFGAKYAGEQTGIVYNNEMDDFSTPGKRNYFKLEPSDVNLIEPGKRPMSSMAPIIIVDNQDNVKLILGASGGSRIISGLAQVALKTLWMNQDLKRAIDARRLHHQLFPEYLEVEDGFDEGIEEYLNIVGHKLRCFNVGGSVIQAIHVQNGTIYAYSDPRKGGTTDGV